MDVRYRLSNRGTTKKPRYNQISPIYIRFGSALTASGYLVDKDHWQIPRKNQIKKDQGLKSTFEPIELTDSQRKKGFKALSDSTLAEISTHILKAHEIAPKSIKRDSAWLKQVMKDFHGISEEVDFDFFDEHLKLKYEEKLPEIEIKKKEKLIELIGKEAFDKRYGKQVKQEPVLKRFLDFQSDRLRVEDINDDFSENYINWMLKKRFMPSYVKSDLIKFKTVLRSASKKGYTTYPLDWKTPKDKGKPKPVTLTWDEIDQLYNHKFESRSLENLRATLLISCYTALRYSDIHKVKGELIKNNRLRITAKKTGQTIMLPIHPRVKELLNEVEIYRVTLPFYDRTIKKVFRLAGINTKVKGRLWGEGVKVTEKEKWEFASSHIGRRSFATNHYGKLPTPLIMKCTGHATEGMFLKYIGETGEDHVEDFLNHWEGLATERSDKQTS